MCAWGSQCLRPARINRDLVGEMFFDEFSALDPIVLIGLALAVLYLTLFALAVVVAFVRKHRWRYLILGLVAVHIVTAGLYLGNLYGEWGNMAWVLGSPIVGVAILVWAVKGKSTLCAKF